MDGTASKTKYIRMTPVVKRHVKEEAPTTKSSLLGSNQTSATSLTTEGTNNHETIIMISIKHKY